MWSLKNMSVSFRVKDQFQAAFHCPVYCGVAQADVQPAVSVRGRVTARSGLSVCGHLLENQLR